MKTVKSAFKFKGGIHPDYNKELARDKAIVQMPVPAELVISMSQHLGAPAKCIVKPGDYVVKGQLIGEKNSGGKEANHFTFQGFLAKVNYENPPTDEQIAAKCPAKCMSVDPHFETGH